ncbi:MAG: cytochrome c [Alphaproteobacteria bacterium]
MRVRSPDRRGARNSSMGMRRIAVLGLAGVAVLAIGAVLQVMHFSDDAVMTTGDPGQVTRGERIYGQYCASCHGLRLEGQPDWRSRKADGKLPAPPHDMTGHTWHHSDEQLFRITKHGLKPPLAPEGYESDMPAFEGVLTDAEIHVVLAFIKSRWPAHIRERQTRLGQEKSR